MRGSTSRTDSSAGTGRDNTSHDQLKHVQARAASEIEVKDATIANLRLQAQLLNVKESLGRILLRDTEDVDVPKPLTNSTQCSRILNNDDE